MARKPKEEAKPNKKDEAKVKLKEAIQEQDLSPEDIIYIHRHNVLGDEKYLVKDIENSLLNKKVITINQHYDSTIRNTDGLRFIIE